MKIIVSVILGIITLGLFWVFAAFYAIGKASRSECDYEDDIYYMMERKDDAEI